MDSYETIAQLENNIREIYEAHSENFFQVTLDALEENEQDVMSAWDSYFQIRRYIEEMLNALAVEKENLKNRRDFHEMEDAAVNFAIQNHGIRFENAPLETTSEQKEVVVQNNEQAADVIDQGVLFAIGHMGLKVP